jgi:hypothetical protein
MLIINQSDRDHFVKHGWVQVSMDLKKTFVEDCYESLKSLELKAKEIKYPLGRIYYSHLFNLNQAAIEAPFNRLLMDDNLVQLFKKIKLGGAVRDLMRWESCGCQLARLFTMDNFNYRGYWHRDYSDWDGNIEGTSSVQVSIYLADQDGFRIWKPEYDYWGKNPILNSNEIKPFASSEEILPVRAEQKFYNTIEGKAGSVLIFSPGLMHQGSCSSKRLDFHMRFANLSKYEKNSVELDKYSSNSFQDFSVLKEYTSDFDPLKDTMSPHLYTPTLKNRFKNSLNYYTSIFNILYLLKRKFLLKRKIPYPFREDVLANTIFQSK